MLINVISTNSINILLYLIFALNSGWIVVCLFVLNNGVDSCVLKAMSLLESKNGVDSCVLEEISLLDSKNGAGSSIIEVVLLWDSKDSTVFNSETFLVELSLKWHP